MTVFVNEVPREVPEDCDLIFLLRHLGVNGSDGLAVAVNEDVVRQESWKGWHLAECDHVLLVRATQGG